MIFEKRMSSKKKVNIDSLLERKGVDEFTLLKEEAIIEGKKAEIWWYMTPTGTFFVATIIQFLFQIYVYRCESGDLIRVRDVIHAVVTGELKRPYVTFYMYPEIEEELRKHRNF